MNLHRCVASLLVGAAIISHAAEQPSGKPTGKPMAMPVRLAVVKQAVVNNEATAVGNLIANESVIVRPEIAGRVTGIHFSEGERIAAGARLVSIDSAEVQAQRASSDAELIWSQQRHDRAVELFQKNFISSQALDEARANLARAKARIAEDDARLRKSEVRAPFAGTLGLRMISPGAYVKAGDDIVRLEDTSVMKLDFRIPETFLARLRRDQAVSMQVDAYPERAFRGRTYAIDSSIDEKTRTVLVRARVPNPGGELRAGMFARVSLVLESFSNALVVPEEAIVPRGGQTFVFRVVEGKAVLTPVETGSRSPGEVQVLKGLSVGDQLVADGHQKLQNGMMVFDAAKAKPAAVPGAPSAAAPIPAK